MLLTDNFVAYVLGYDKNLIQETCKVRFLPEPESMHSKGKSIANVNGKTEIWEPAMRRFHTTHSYFSERGNKFGEIQNIIAKYIKSHSKISVLVFIVQ